MALREGSVSLSETLEGSSMVTSQGSEFIGLTAGDIDNDTGAALSSTHLHLWITLSVY